MANLSQVVTTNTTGQVLYNAPQNPIIEPLDGPNSIASLIADRFPDTIYQQGTDTRLYKFLTALAGNSGAGQLKQQSLRSRLKNEGPLLIWHDLDTYYANIFNFPRLKSETYTYDPNTMALEKQIWDKITDADRSYRRRILDFFHATRLGNSPAGIQLAARAGSGEDIDIIENYRYIFDLLSDDPLGVTRTGDSNSVHEFVVQPRIMPSGTNNDIFIDLTINASAGSFVIFYSTIPSVTIAASATAQMIEDAITHNDLLEVGDVVVEDLGQRIFRIHVINPSFNPFFFSVVENEAMLISGGTVDLAYPLKDTFYVAQLRGPSMDYYESIIQNVNAGIWVDDRIRAGDITSESTVYLDPEIERNMVNTLDHIRPVSSLMSLKPVTERLIPVASQKVYASSENIHISRFVTGNPNVPWPSSDPSQGFFIDGTVLSSQPGGTVGQVVELSVENEATFWSFESRAIPVVYQTIDTVKAYRDDALSDVRYGTESFYTDAYPFYRSEHEGYFVEVTTLTWYNFLKTIQSDDIFPAALAIAATSTPLIIQT